MVPTAFDCLAFVSVLPFAYANLFLTIYTGRLQMIWTGVETSNFIVVKPMFFVTLAAFTFKHAEGGSLDCSVSFPVAVESQHSNMAGRISLIVILLSQACGSTDTKHCTNIDHNICCQCPSPNSGSCSYSWNLLCRFEIHHAILLFLFYSSRIIQS